MFSSCLPSCLSLQLLLSEYPSNYVQEGRLPEFYFSLVRLLYYFSHRLQCDGYVWEQCRFRDRRYRYSSVNGLTLEIYILIMFIRRSAATKTAKNATEGFKHCKCQFDLITCNWGQQYLSSFPSYLAIARRRIISGRWSASYVHRPHRPSRDVLWAVCRLVFRGLKLHVQLAIYRTVWETLKSIRSRLPVTD